MRILVEREHVQDTGESKEKCEDAIGQRGHSVQRVNGIFARECYFKELIQLVLLSMKGLTQKASSIGIKEIFIPQRLSLFLKKREGKEGELKGINKEEK